MSTVHYIKSTANDLTVWWKAIKSNRKWRRRCFFLSLLWALFSKTFRIHYFTVKNSEREMPVAETVRSGRYGESLRLPSLRSCIVKQHVNMWHGDPYSADGDIQYTCRRATHMAARTFVPHDAVTGGITVEYKTHSTGWGQMITAKKNLKKSHSWWFRGSLEQISFIAHLASCINTWTIFS